MGYIDRIKKWWEEAASETEIDIDTEEFPIEVISSEQSVQERNLWARLHVPTKKDGATFSQSGWKVGDGTLSRTTTSGTIEEDMYKDHVALLNIKKDEIEIGVLLSDDVGSVSSRHDLVNQSGPERTIRIPMTEITDVKYSGMDAGGYFETFPGFSFETTDDLYKLGFYAPNSLTDRTDIEEGWIEEIVERVQTQSDKQVSDGDAIEKIERLKNLHEKGALSDAEFENKKNKNCLTTCENLISTP
jgi:hypothetical protein